ncbi:nicotinate-nucleotide adenylyltransferase [Vagococcus coleopterorum]|uniref:Probable nicotinate-nucleotide adenylyltransferase n=1 Tax=Vagococcus coleopterorum TaxID=2714946 RepID=A0A6G8AN64_9ENTE|nr:nicotinate-nucleotide adenylyltransferase [Vagococcus coleopterorum]QIL46382.1 nicotinate-nucleotide adenylyltransferase [Vagococcus coleopterorum]
MTTELNKRKRVGILGGSFNPIHYGHLVMADQVKHELALDECYLMPTYTPPHIDKKTTLSSDLRLDMLELAVAGQDSLKIETCELDRGGVSYTYDTMAELVEKNSNTDYFFIIGGDMVDYLPKWYRLEDLLELVTLVAVKRPGYGESSSYPVTWVEAPLMSISSSLIRNHISEGKSVNYFLPENVLNYIQDKGLYQDV